MVVRPGQEKAPAGTPSKPRIETSCGHSSPASRTASMRAERHQVVGAEDRQVPGLSPRQQALHGGLAALERCSRRPRSSRIAGSSRARCSARAPSGGTGRGRGATCGPRISAGAACPRESRWSSPSRTAWRMSEPMLGRIREALGARADQHHRHAEAVEIVDIVGDRVDDRALDPGLPQRAQVVGLAAMVPVGRKDQQRSAVLARRYPARRAPPRPRMGW